MLEQSSELLKIRPAAIADTKIIVDLIKELAIYEKLEYEVNASEELIRKNLNPYSI